jgi:hypothetical protein
VSQNGVMVLQHSFLSPLLIQSLHPDLLLPTTLTKLVTFKEHHRHLTPYLVQLDSVQVQAQHLQIVTIHISQWLFNTMQPIDTKVNKMRSKILSEPLQLGIGALTQLVSCCTYTLPKEKLKEQVKKIGILFCYYQKFKRKHKSFSQVLT